ncbi:MAG: hypothetical protein Q9169_008279 [Polycauliona sp. 2 TL-2023]
MTSILFLLTPLVTAYTGWMSYYTPGLGSCGTSNHEGEDVVALSRAIMGTGADTNHNPKCGSWIGIWNPHTKKHYSAKVVDTCIKCGAGDIDVSASLFSKIAPVEVGVVQGINWGGPMVGG